MRPDLLKPVDEVLPADPAPLRHGGDSEPDFTCEYPFAHSAERADHRAVFDHDVVRHRCVTCEGDAVADDRAATDGALPGDQTVSPDRDVMADLHQVIQLAAGPDAGDSERGPGVGSVSTNSPVPSGTRPSVKACSVQE